MVESFLGRLEEELKLRGRANGTIYAYKTYELSIFQTQHIPNKGNHQYCGNL